MGERKHLVFAEVEKLMEVAKGSRGDTWLMETTHYDAVQRQLHRK
jgi:hypothetical protein